MAEEITTFTRLPDPPEHHIFKDSALVQCPRCGKWVTITTDPESGCGRCGLGMFVKIHLTFWVEQTYNEEN